MYRIKLWNWLRDNGIAQEQAARATGLTHAYVNSILKGRMPFTDSVRLKFIETYPQTATFLLQPQSRHYLEDHFDMAAERSHNPGTYVED